MDKRILATERNRDGECAVCGRRHKHRDDCATLKRRESKDGAPTPGGTPS